jgi:hypothetical protein
MKNDYDRPLEDCETKEKTLGCRHSNPDICAKHSMPNVCAFVRDDGICLSPPVTWEKLYIRLKQGSDT